MSTALDKLKAACAGKTYKSFNQLAVGEYVVHNFSSVNTAHGTRVRIVLDHHYMLLPERFNNILDDNTLNELNSTPMIMVYGGKDLAHHNRLILDFQTIDYLAQQMFKPPVNKNIEF